MFGAPDYTADHRTRRKMRTISIASWVICIQISSTFKSPPLLESQDEQVRLRGHHLEEKAVRGRMVKPALLLVQPLLELGVVVSEICLSSDRFVVSHVVHLD